VIYSPEVVNDVLLEYKRTRSPFRTAKLVGLDTAIVWQIIEENADKLSAHPERNGGFGRPELTRYIVGRRKVSSRQWDNDDEKIALARSCYELGSHDMATARDGGWLILYSIPNRSRQPRAGYFKPEVF
jgi:hypothetical protein